jgi:hypothetical protein
MGSAPSSLLALVPKQSPLACLLKCWKNLESQEKKKKKKKKNHIKEKVKYLGINQTKAEKEPRKTIPSIKTSKKKKKKKKTTNTGGFTALSQSVITT